MYLFGVIDVAQRQETVGKSCTGSRIRRETLRCSIRFTDEVENRYMPDNGETSS